MSKKNVTSNPFWKYEQSVHTFLHSLIHLFINELQVDNECVKSSLQLKDEINLHQKGWIIQRIGWSILLLFLVASFTGIFGTGWLSKKKLADNSNAVSFEKFGRHESLMKILFRAQAQQGVEIKIPQAYMETMQIEKIVPEPADQKFSGDALIYLFEGDGQSVIQFYLKPQSIGSIKARVSVNESDFLISHFIYP